MEGDAKSALGSYIHGKFVSRKSSKKKISLGPNIKFKKEIRLLDVSPNSQDNQTTPGKFSRDAISLLEVKENAGRCLLDMQE